MDAVGDTAGPRHDGGDLRRHRGSSLGQQLAHGKAVCGRQPSEPSPTGQPGFHDLAVGTAAQLHHIASARLVIAWAQSRDIGQVGPQIGYFPRWIEAQLGPAVGGALSFLQLFGATKVAWVNLTAWLLGQPSAPHPAISPHKKAACVQAALVHNAVLLAPALRDCTDHVSPNKPAFRLGNCAESTPEDCSATSFLHLLVSLRQHLRPNFPLNQLFH
jgi:hypothetical protein